MLPKTIALSALMLAASATLAVPNAYADFRWEDFFNNTDGGGNVFAHVPDRVRVPATPEQAANLRFLETQRQVSDGSANVFADIPDRVKVPATPEQAANLRFLEGQRQISDGSGQWSGGSDTGASLLQMQARGHSSERVQ